MGGLDSEITETTTTVALESALFDPFRFAAQPNISIYVVNHLRALKKESTKQRLAKQAMLQQP